MSPPFPQRAATAQSDPGRLNALTGLRFVAAACIVVQHSTGLFGFSNFRESYGLNQAVSLFFVLSGFVLTYAYATLRDTIAVRRFYAVRIARIWPAHLAGLLLLLAIMPVANMPLPSSHQSLAVLANVFLLQAWIPLEQFMFTLNAPTWTLSVEVFFYLLFPYLVRRFEHTWLKKLGLALALQIGVITLATLSGFHSVLAFACFPPGHLFEFVLGMTMELVRRRLSPRINPNHRTATALELTLVALVAVSMPATVQLATRSRDVLGRGIEEWLVMEGSTLLYAPLLVVMALQRGSLSALLARRLPVRLGDISYSIYIIHYILLRYYRFHTSAFAFLPNWLTFAVFWIILLTLSHLSWGLIERPCQSWVRTLWTPASGVGAPDAVSARRQSVRMSSFPSVRAGFVLILEGALAICLMLTAGYLVRHRHLDFVTLSAVTDELATSRPEAREVEFGDRFLLHALTLTRTADGVTAQLIWESMQDQPLSFINAVHIVDEHGTILAQADYRQDAESRQVRRGTCWRESVNIPLARLQGGSALAFAVYDSEAVSLRVNRGPRDWDGHRLVLQLDPTAQPLDAARAAPLDATDHRS